MKSKKLIFVHPDIFLTNNELQFSIIDYKYKSKYRTTNANDTLT